MFLGNCPGSIGELSALALISGGIYLLRRNVISRRIPLGYIGSVAILTLIFHKTDDAVSWMLYQLFSGGLMLGAFFMATDFVTSPVTKPGQWIFGIGCGVLTVIFRYYGLFPEGVTYAILLMNLFVWVIDRYTPPRIYGYVKGGAPHA
jgi:electron transport complex protein RnfD